MGTPEFAVPTLLEIMKNGHLVVAVYTRAPARGGRRGLEIRKTPVHLAADSFGIPIFTPKTLRDVEAHKVFSSLAADVAVVAAYGLLLPNPILEAPRLGCINLHASLLPRWRGAAPIQRAIMAGDSQTGLDVMRMDAGLDTGPIAMREIIPILPEDTAGDLTARLATIAGQLVGERPKIVGGWSTRISGATGCGRLLCAQDREKRGGDRLDAGRGESSQSGSRAVACAGRLFEALHWRSRGKYQILACRNDRRERTAWNTPFRRHENRVRHRRDTGSSGATIRKDCHERPRIDAGREARTKKKKKKKKKNKIKKNKKKKKKKKKKTPGTVFRRSRAPSSVPEA